MHGKLNLRIALLSIAALSILGYSYSRTADLIRGPQILVSAPENGGTVRSPIVHLEGTIKNSARITINGRSVFADEKGVLREEILLAEGYNRITLTAEDRFGRKTEETVEVVRKN